MFNILLDVFLWLCSCLIIFSGDVEVNPRPKNSASECLLVSQKNILILLFPLMITVS